MSDSEAFLYVYSLQFIFIHITICQHVQYRLNSRCSVFLFLLGTDVLSVQLEVWICCVHFSLKAHKSSVSVFWLGAFQRPDLSRLTERPWCLPCNVPPHCAVAIFYSDIFEISHTSPNTVLLYCKAVLFLLSWCDDEGLFLSSAAQFCLFFCVLFICILYFCVNISFATFVSQREDYILTLLECLFKF